MKSVYSERNHCAHPFCLVC
uniref:Uncharacterized protein n=1 Tax=Anguilla anguilla TaxID=7936 RepID=A0A0E9RC77_ANGAN